MDFKNVPERSGRVEQEVDVPDYCDEAAPKGII